MGHLRYTHTRLRNITSNDVSLALNRDEREPELTLDALGTPARRATQPTPFGRKKVAEKFFQSVSRRRRSPIGGPSPYSTPDPACSAATDNRQLSQSPSSELGSSALSGANNPLFGLGSDWTMPAATKRRTTTKNSCDAAMR